MRNTQGYGAWDRNGTEMGRLHPRCEPVTFYCSHRCLLTRRLGQGRVRCVNTGASRNSEVAAIGIGALRSDIVESG
jgi:hypothetical protein